MRRVRISPILCRCVVSKSQIEFLRKRRGNLRKVGNVDLRSLSCIKSTRKAFQLPSDAKGINVLRRGKPCACPYFNHCPNEKGEGRSICDRLPLISTIERVDGSTKRGFAKVTIPTPRMVMNTRCTGDMHFFLERGGVSCDDREYASQTQIFRAFYSDP